MIKIAIGTASHYKSNAIKKAIYELDIDFESQNFKADSGVSEQPRSEGETRLGSINKAQHFSFLKSYKKH